MGDWKECKRKNTNRGYRKLRVWQDAIEYYVMTCEVFRRFPSDLKRLVESLERKKSGGDWEDSLLLRESNAVYECADERELSSTHPSFHPSNLPIFHPSILPPPE
jgi:hypothetical protein